MPLLSSAFVLLIKKVGLALRGRVQRGSASRVSWSRPADRFFGERTDRCPGWPLAKRMRLSSTEASAASGDANPQWYRTARANIDALSQVGCARKVDWISLGATARTSEVGGMRREIRRRASCIE